MSMDNDTRLAMMNMRNDARTAQAVPARRRNFRRYRRIAGATVTAFALTLFTRGA
ncbi:hypothetical protein [Pseudodesulfovibrio portus]|jgi:hypothetical protein|uniref:Uncharacterized protein n=1 Tax=Pseudodesulfovibrio portus TaxID=231439 RepID=A0ABN6RX25_9BACT|nr:hypothetical protein [Pseudodesulfovibrio portus]BDQ34288.1 hypothetical protein JCM14722_18300 [Pseudodesulfovibrio portus]